MRVLLLAILAASLAGCVGQSLDQAKVQSVRVGSTKAQVQAALGTPFYRQMMPNGEENWQYVSASLVPGRSGQGMVQVYFKGDTVTRCMFQGQGGLTGPGPMNDCGGL